jgi:hypothetical protein
MVVFSNNGTVSQINYNDSFGIRKHFVKNIALNVGNNLHCVWRKERKNTKAAVGSCPGGGLLVRLVVG